LASKSSCHWLLQCVRHSRCGPGIAARTCQPGKRDIRASSARAATALTSDIACCCRPPVCCPHPPPLGRQRLGTGGTAGCGPPAARGRRCWSPAGRGRIAGDKVLCQRNGVLSGASGQLGSQAPTRPLASMCSGSRVWEAQVRAKIGAHTCAACASGPWVAPGRWMHCCMDATRCPSPSLSRSDTSL